MPRPATLPPLAPAPIAAPRRGLRAEEAAGYIGVSTRTFLTMVESREMPQGAKLRGCRIWDMRQLDLALDRLFDLNEPGAENDDEWIPRA